MSSSNEDDDAAVREVEIANAARLGRTLDNLAGRIGGHADVRAVFGEPVTHDGVTVIPVARVVGGFGAGSSGSNPGDGSAAAGGIGGAGGFFAAPVGYIQIDRHGARFRGIEGPLGPWSGVAEIALRLAADGVQALQSAWQRRRRG